ncbi:hypothetical protein FKP32DRAFT_325215 [Trametes sanguinea]|nr:hypothetical protein FKP32DRAFT_325215 [Trametes sanguinea]
MPRIRRNERLRPATRGCLATSSFPLHAMLCPRHVSCQPRLCALVITTETSWHQGARRRAAHWRTSNFPHAIEPSISDRERCGPLSPSLASLAARQHSNALAGSGARETELGPRARAPTARRPIRALYVYTQHRPSAAAFASGLLVSARVALPFASWACARTWPCLSSHCEHQRCLVGLCPSRAREAQALCAAYRRARPRIGSRRARRRGA